MNHWFDGLAMLHRFSFANGAVSYANRFLETRAWRAARDNGRIEYSEFATDPCRSLFQRASAIFPPKFSDNANVNLTELGERFIAMTEAPLPVQFDPETLAAMGLPHGVPGTLTTAHPHLDRESRGIAQLRRQAGTAHQLPDLHLGSRRDRAQGHRDQAPARARLHAFVWAD